MQLAEASCADGRHAHAAKSFQAVRSSAHSSALPESLAPSGKHSACHCRMLENVRDGSCPPRHKGRIS